MEQTYTQANLVSFGNYLLNTDRFIDYRHPELEDAELFFQVYDADLANWSEKEGLDYSPIWPDKIKNEDLYLNPDISIIDEHQG